MGRTFCWVRDLVEGYIGSSKLDLAGLVFRFGFGFLVGLCRTFG